MARAREMHQARVKRQYPALEEGDEPPYPLHGLQPIYKWIMQAQHKVNATNGRDYPGAGFHSGELAEHRKEGR